MTAVAVVAVPQQREGEEAREGPETDGRVWVAVAWRRSSAAVALGFNCGVCPLSPSRRGGEESEAETRINGVRTSWAGEHELLLRLR